jgi:hypothetical protein
MLYIFVSAYQFLSGATIICPFERLSRIIH